MASTSAEVLTFWFGADEARGRARTEWFRKDDAFDAAIHDRFGALLDEAGRSVLWRDAAADERACADADPDPGAARLDLARILVCDQFSRNVWREDPRAFSLDAVALVHAGALLANGRHLQLSLLERWFAYMPFEHAETRALQALSVSLFERLQADADADVDADADGVAGALASALDFAKRHRDVISRFGRFPHRNAVLGRTDSEAERVFLAQPGSRF